MRKAQDIGVRTMRQLVNTYAKSNEDIAEFTMRAIHIVRLYMEEALHRTLLGYEDPVMRGAFCSLYLTLRNLEEGTIGTGEVAIGTGEGKRMRSPWPCTLGIFWSFNEVNVRSIGLLMRQESSSVEDLPSFREAMKNADMRHEVFSLMPLRRLPGTIAVSHREVRALIEANGHRNILDEEVEATGVAEVSKFAELFA